MDRLSKITLVGVLALTMAGCGSGDESVAPTPSATPSQAVQPSAKSEPFAKPPVVAQLPAVVVPPIPGIIQTTNAQERAKLVSKGGRDPFAIIPGQSIQTLSTATPSQRTVPSLPKLPTTGTPSRITVPPVRTSIRTQPTKISRGSSRSSKGGSAGSEFRPGRGNLLPPVVPGNRISPFLPPAPRTDLANAVAVTGVVQVGSETEAIVQVPNEATSRYVRVGQRLSNGQVLVKRIEVNQGSVPVVILEQYGTEVPKAVGEQPAKGGQPTAAIPASLSWRNWFAAGA